ncbi:ESPR-type extended signal peptide-containing protein [Acinetobacter sp. CE-15]|uniref:ESPR-type extended signal peptide-containing protein n=1 Tax=Acinetobacter sp. CE-15 TaxID=3425693 RepID=UPI003DA37078
MNKIYKVIWNATLSAWVAVSELAKGKTKSSKVTGIVGAATVSLMITFSSDVTANVINTDSNNCITGSNGIVGTINPGTTGGQATDGSGTYSTVAGCNAKGNGLSAVTAYGAFSEVTGNAGTAIGHNSQANAFGTAVGVESRATGVGSTALGEGSQSTGQNAVALGGTATGTASGNVVSVANAVTASGSGSVAIGGNATRGAQSTGTDSIAIGGQSRATNTGTIAIGKNAFTGAVGTESLNNIAIGTNASNSNLTSGNPAGTGGQIALGNGAKTTTFAQIAIGDNSNAGGNNYAIAIGGGATVTANSGVAVGGVAMGRNTQAGSFAVGVGPGAQATGANSTALGNAATANNTNSTALGNGAQATGLASTALGTAAVASIDNSVALGNGSTTTAITGTGFLTSQTAPTVGAVSVGNGTVTGNRRIQNVADGSAASDAVTVAQLDKAYDDAHTNLKNVLGGNAAYDPVTNTYTAPTNIGGTGKTTIDDAIKATQRSVTGGSNIVVTPTTAADGSISYSVATSATPTFTTVTTGNSKLDNSGLTITGGPSVTSGGINAANTTINNVANATTADQAVNKGQLDTVSTQANKAITFTGNARKSGDTTDINRKLGDSIAISGTATTAGTYSGANVKTVTDQNGAIAIQIADAPNFAGTVTSTGLQVNGASAVTGNSTIGGTQTVTGISNLNGGANLNSQKITNVAAGAATGDAVNFGQLTTTNQNVSNLTTTVTNQGTDISTLKGGFNLQSNGKNSGAIKAGDTVDIGVATPADTNLTATKTGNNVAFALSKDLNLTSVTTGNTVINNAGVTADKVTVGTVVVDKTTGINAGGKKITNVAAGDISTAASTDAVNGGQLFTTNQNVSNLTTTVTNQGNQITTNTSDISTLKGGFNLQTNGKSSGAIKAGDTVDIGVATPSDTNLTATKTGNNVAFALSKDLNLTSVTTGNTVINNAGVTADKVTVGTVVVDKTTGINAGGKKITNVAAGDISTAASTDAVNGGQLFTTNQNVAKNTSDISTLNTTVTNQGNQITTNTSNIATNTSDISTLKGGFNLQTNGKNGGAIKAGDTVDIGVATPADTNLTATKTGNNVAFALSKDLNLTSVTTGNTVINNAGVTADKVTVGTVVVDKTTGINAGGKKITNVAAGDISTAASTDAVNGGQLFTTNQNVSNLTTTVTNQGTDISTLKGGFNLQTNGKNSGAIKAGDTVDIGVATPADTNLTATKTGNNVAFALSKDLNLTSVTTGNTVINNAGVTADKVTVGTVVVDKTTGINAGGKKITNVAAGDISTAASTDAVNGGQLFTTNQNVAKNTSDISTLNTTVTNQGNQITTNTSNIATNTSDISTLKGGFNLQTNGKNSGAIKAGDTVDIGVATPADTNLTATKTGNNVAFALSKDLNLTSVTTGNTVINNAGVTADKVTVGTVVVDKTTGINAGGKKITNVAAGDISTAASTDAVNGGQLFTTNQNVAKNTSDISTLNTTVTNQGNQITTNTSDISTLKGGFNLQTNGKNSGAIKAGDTIDIGVATPADTNLTATKTGNNVAFALSKDLNLTSVTTGNTVINTAGITADKVTVGNVVIDKTTNKISGVEAGTDTKDVVNKGQLDALAGQQTATDNSAVKYDNATTKDKVTLGGGAAGTTLTNVKAGDVSANSTDAINGSQLYTTNQNVAQNSKDIATNTSNIATNTSDITTLKGGFNLQTNGKNSGAIKAGDTVDIGVATPADTNLTATKTGNNVAFALSKDLNLTSITTGNTVINTAGITADKVTVGNVVIDKTTNKISGVEAGTDTKDVVNKGQLDALAGQQTATDNSAVKYDNATTKDKVTLGGGAAGTTLTNVKAGDVSANSTDAINGSQLYTTNQNVAQNSKDIATNTSNIATNTSDITTLKGGFNLQTNGKNSGAIKAGDTVDIGVATPADTNLTATKTGNNVAFALSKDLNLTSITTGNTVINTAGITADKVTVGNVVIDKTTNKISGVEAGTDTKDVVNKGQLDALAGQQTATDNSAVKYDNATTKDKVTLGGGAAGTTLTNVKAGDVSANSTDAINGSQLYTTNQNVAQNSKDIATNTSNIATNTSDITTLKGGFNLQTNGKNSGAIKAGDTVDIGVATPADTNLTATKTGNNVAFALSKDLNLTSITTGNTVINTAGITADKVTVGNVVIDKTTNKISGVEAGTDTKDVVNKGQLDALAGQQTATDNSAVKYDNATTKDKVTLGGGAAGTTLTNVKAGDVSANSTDAINGSQLYTTNQNVAQNSKDIATNTSNIATNTSNIATNTSDITTLKGGFNLQTNGKNSGAIKAGDTIDIGVATPADTNLTATKTGNNVAFALSKDLNLTSITVNDGINGTNGSTVIGKDGISVKDGSGNTIAGVDNTALTVKDGSGNTETSINKAINSLNASQGETDKFAVKYDKNADGSANYNNITLAGSASSSTKDATTGKITTTGGTSLNNVASAGDYTKEANASKGVNAGDLNNAVVDATNAATSKGFALQAADGAKVQKNLGEAVEVVGADSNITTKVANGQVAIELNKNLNNLTGITVNDGTNGTNGSTVIGKDGISVKDGSGNTIVGVDNTALTVKDGSGNTETSINKAINTLNASQGETDKFAVKYDKNADGSANYNNITLAGSASSSTKDATTGKITTTGGTSLNNVASAGDYTKEANASKGVNAGDLNNAVVDATNAATSKGFALQAADGAKVQKNLGEAVEVVGADSNITTKVANGQVAIELNKNLNNLTGITVNDGTNGTNGSTVIGKDGISVKDGSGNTIVGVDNTALTVKDGSGNTETSINKAINTLNASQGETDKFAVKYDKNADGSANYNNITLAGSASSSTKDATTGKITTTGGTSLNNVASAGDYTKEANASKGVNAGDLNNAVVDATNAATSKGFALQAADGAKVQKNLGEAVEVVGADSNITTKVANGQVAIELNKNLNNLTGITVNDGTNGTNGSTVIGKDGISVKDGSGNTIVGLDNTALTVKDGSGNTETSINKAINTLNASQGETDKFAVKYDKNADGSANYDSVTLAGTGGTTITNVKAGAINATSTDAINGSQLYDVGNSLKNAIGGLTTRDATTGIITTSNIGGTGSNTIDGAINSIKDSATKAKTTVTAGDNVVVTAGTNADGSSNYQVATAKDVNFDKVTVGNVVVNKASNTIEGLSNTDLRASDFATKGRAATEEQLKQAVTKNITEVVDGNGNKVNIIDQVVNTKPDNKNQDSLFLTYDKQGQETTDRLTIGQTVQKMNTNGIKFFHTNADMSKGDLGTTNDSSAGGLNSTAIGVNAIVATGADSAVALGHNTKAEGKQSIAIGQGAEALGTQSISIGTGNKVKGNHSGAIGDPTIVDGANSYSVGNNNQVLTDDTFVLGNNVTKTVAGSVVLGNGSAATTGAGVAGYALSAATSADKTAISNTTSTTGAVAVGDAASGIYRQITGVAAGSADADAVNVAQLKAVGNQVVTTQNALVNGLGGNAKVNADGTITGPTYNVAQGNQSNVGDALTALDKAIGSAATTSKTTVSNGQNIVVNKSKNADGSDNYEVSTAKDLTVDSVKAGDTVLNNAGISIGNNAVVINNTGLTIAGGPSVTVAGINAGNKTITNVANAVNATDAVNKGQLDSAIGNVNNNVNELANNAVKYDDASKDKITLGGGTNGTTISNVKDGAVTQGSKDAVNGGQLWNVQQQVDQNSTDISNIKNDINNGTVGLVQQAGKDATVTVAKDTGGTSVSVAGTDGNRVVTGVKDGAVNATSKDAVNGSQLNTTNQAVVNYLGGGAGYDNITGSFTAPTYNVGDSKYNNVGGAIDALNQADQALNSKIDNVSNKLDNAFRITNNRIDDVEKKANAGIAAAMALESAPYIPGKYTYAAGAAYHGGENAVGVTLRKTADNGRWSITGGVAAASQGDPSVRIGISGVID